jgi:hypothetical protein
VVEFLFSRDGIYAYAVPDEAQEEEKALVMSTIYRVF